MLHVTRELEGGRWVRVGLIRHWVPAGQSLATHRTQRARLRAVAAERYAEPTWWPTPPHDDSELTCARRLREAIAEADEHKDHRRGAVA